VHKQASGSDPDDSEDNDSDGQDDEDHEGNDEDEKAQKAELVALQNSAADADAALKRHADQKRKAVAKGAQVSSKEITAAAWHLVASSSSSAAAGKTASNVDKVRLKFFF
jgi:adenylosuccinate synthase